MLIFYIFVISCVVLSSLRADDVRVTSPPVLFAKTARWSAHFNPKVVESETTTFKVSVAVKVSKDVTNEGLIKADCGVQMEKDTFRPCVFDNSDPSLSRNHTTHNDTQWRILKPQPHFKRDGDVAELVVSRVESPDVATLERGVIRCCLLETETSNYLDIDAAFVVRLTPNLRINWTSANEEGDESATIHYDGRSESECSGADDWEQRWWPFLCVVHDNSPYLGHFYAQTTPSLNNLKAFNSRHTAKSSQTTNIPPAFQSYVYGSPIRTLRSGYLTLPSAILDGKCVATSPVRFLISQTSQCNYLITKTLCTKQNVALNAKRYVDERNAYVVSANGDGGETLNVTISVLCGKTSNLCSNDVELGYNSHVNICENVISDVSYAFRWRGPRLTSLHVTLRLENITVTNKRYVTVRYSTSYVHDESGEVLRRRSGNPGYVTQEKLITATGDVNQTQFNANVTQSLRLPKADGDGNCASDGEDITFGNDVISGCKLRVDSCQNLSKVVTDWLRVTLLPAQLVSKTGNPQLNNSQHFLQINREGTSLSSVSNETCVSAPLMLMRVTVGYAESGQMGQLRFYTLKALDIRSWSNVECYNGCVTTSKATVTLKMAVEFVALPNSTDSTKKFWLKQSAVPCSQDSCWADIVSPLYSDQWSDEGGGDHNAHLASVTIALLTAGGAVLALLIAHSHVYIMKMLSP